MTKPSNAIFHAAKFSIVAGTVLGAAAICGYFEPQYTCTFAISTATKLAQILAAVMIFGAVLVLHIQNKALKAHEARLQKTDPVSDASDAAPLSGDAPQNPVR